MMDCISINKISTFHICVYNYFNIEKHDRKGKYADKIDFYMKKQVNFCFTRIKK
jgi:hypothetical protein